MTKELLKEAFYTAQILTGQDSINARAEYLAEFITEEHKYPINPKSIYRYYQEGTTPKKEVLDALAVFVGYENYEDFVVGNRKDKVIEQPKARKRDRKGIGRIKVIGAIVIISMVSFALLYAWEDKKECIVWVEDHYEPSRCSGDPLERPFSMDLLENFEKVEVSGKTSFFKNGKAAIWYDKSNKMLTFFTAPGVHPTNGKTLKPITEYMINKYIKDQEP